MFSNTSKLTVITMGITSYMSDAVQLRIQLQEGQEGQNQPQKGGTQTETADDEDVEMWRNYLEAQLQKDMVNLKWEPYVWYRYDWSRSGH
jgi:hypothetical protein